MYKITDGILRKDGKKVFAIGESYYPSFHPCKFPVKPEDDRVGEMKKDLKMMAEAGFNHVRIAALGDVTYDGENRRVTIDAPFVDAMLRESQKNGLSNSVRLQGFSVNLRGFPDGDMIDAEGNVPAFTWADFVRTTPNHPGILEDNFLYAKDLAAHFAKFPSVVGFQTYNEPKYPRPHGHACDYNPHTIAAFRKWLVERGVLTAEEAETYEPPRGRQEQAPEMWALWRVFSAEKLTAFLANASKGAGAGANLPTFTCSTADTVCKTNPRRGVDAFGNAKTMELVGYTNYKHAWGAEYFPMCLDSDVFQCAAELEGKEAWCVELDSRTYIEPSVYNKGTYATVGSGVKGIIYYQWRGDCPVPGVPHPNSCGILNYDGTKTKNYDNALQVNKWLTSVSDFLVNAHRAKEGVGLFYSLYAPAWCDSMENRDLDTPNKVFFNASVMAMNHIYAELRRAGYTVTMVDGEHLEKSGLKVLIVPDFTHLSGEEKAAIDRFHKAGGKVYMNLDTGRPTNSFCALTDYQTEEPTYKQRQFAHPYTAYDLPELTGITPIAVSLDPNVGVQALQGDGYTLLVLTNLSPLKKTVDAKLKVSMLSRSAVFTAIDGDKAVSVCGEEVTVHGMTDGGMLILR